MFSFDHFIDTVQTAKKTAVNHFIKHEAIARSMNEFVDAQTAYTKAAMKAGTDAATKISQELIEANSECITKILYGHLLLPPRKRRVLRDISQRSNATCNGTLR